MIVEMKKISLLVLESEKREALKTLRKLGLVHISQIQGSGETLDALQSDRKKLETAAALLEELREKKSTVPPVEQSVEDALQAADQILAAQEERKNLETQINQNIAEMDRIEFWGDFNPGDFELLKEKGIPLTPYEMSLEGYESIGDELTTMVVSSDKYSVRVLVLGDDIDPELLPAGSRKFDLPASSISELKRENESLLKKQNELQEEMRAHVPELDSIREGIAVLDKNLEFENYASGMETEKLLETPVTDVGVAYLIGYIPTKDLSTLLDTAKAQGWGIAVEDPTQEDDVPTKLENNKFVSLIYPLTDFLGTVPGYFEYDISGWFLAFILIFFGIIFGDGGYGLLIGGVALALIIKTKISGKEVAPLYYLLGLFGIATIIWGCVTCTWFGLPVESIPEWLQRLSIPVLSNVNEDRIWYPFWTNGAAGLTTAQNLQIFCFAIAVIQLSVAHIKAIIRYCKTLRFLGDLGSMLMVWGMFYIVLMLVVNGEVFDMGLVIGGIPVGTVAIALIALGFVLNFIFGSYEGSIKDSILDSLTNIVSILLGVVNVFSDIVSYIRLWAVGLAGAAISTTINEMAGPLLGRLSFLIFAILILVFGHGLNIILNVLSLIVHGVRLNTLEFSSHLGMSWSGHKYEPFEE